MYTHQSIRQQVITQTPTHTKGVTLAFSFQLLSALFAAHPFGSLLISQCAQNIVARVHLPFTVANAVAFAVADAIP